MAEEPVNGQLTPQEASRLFNEMRQLLADAQQKLHELQELIPPDDATAGGAGIEPGIVVNP